jgi:hypothetical protein
VTTLSELGLGSVFTVTFSVRGRGHAALLLLGINLLREVADVASAGFNLGETAAEGRIAILSRDSLPIVGVP